MKSKAEKLICIAVIQIPMPIKMNLNALNWNDDADKFIWILVN